MDKKAAKKTAKRNAKSKKGSQYACSDCGMIVTIDNDCGCAQGCDLICCGEPMSPKK